MNLTWYLKVLYHYKNIAKINNQVFKFCNLKKFENPKEFVRSNYLENLKYLYR